MRFAVDLFSCQQNGRKLALLHDSALIHEGVACGPRFVAHTRTKAENGCVERLGYAWVGPQPSRQPPEFQVWFCKFFISGSRGRVRSPTSPYHTLVVVFPHPPSAVLNESSPLSAPFQAHHRCYVATLSVMPTLSRTRTFEFKISVILILLSIIAVQYRRRSRLRFFIYFFYCFLQTRRRWMSWLFRESGVMV
jgi:hypothetical protein